MRHSKSFDAMGANIKTAEPLVLQLSFTRAAARLSSAIGQRRLTA
jgi:hypothetical protein